MTDRRSFLKHGSLAAIGLVGLPRWMRIMDPMTPAGPDAVRALAMQAVDAARQAGATYAEARLTRRLTESFHGGALGAHGEEFGVAVRAMVDGYWGFAASPYWAVDDVVDQARNAVHQAKAYARGRPRSIEWAPIPVASGSWATPIRIDPFTVPIEEKIDHFDACRSMAVDFHRHTSGLMTTVFFVRTERAVATTEGAYFTQTVYLSGGNFVFQLGRWAPDGSQLKSQSTEAEGLQICGAGWELVLDANIPDQFPALLARCEAAFKADALPTKPGDVGRYTVVCDAATMSGILVNTIGAGTQLDRALGDEANTGLTSYLGPDPMAFLGTSVAAPLVTVHADRSMPRGLATVQWDAEGVHPTPFALVEKGVLVDYQTTREQAAWLAPWYAKRGQPVRSHGCAESESGLFTTMQHMPNLTLDPGVRDIGFDEMVASTPRGLAIMRGSCEPNFNGGQMLIRRLHCREIVDGHLGAQVTGIVALFGATEFWKHVVALGGPSSAQQIAYLGASKGEPQQSSPFSVSAVPATVTNVAFISGARAAT